MPTPRVAIRAVAILALVCTSSAAAEPAADAVARQVAPISSDDGRPIEVTGHLDFGKTGADYTARFNPATGLFCVIRDPRDRAPVAVIFDDAQVWYDPEAGRVVVSDFRFRFYTEMSPGGLGFGFSCLRRGAVPVRPVPALLIDAPALLAAAPLETRLEPAADGIATWEGRTPRGGRVIATLAGDPPTLRALQAFKRDEDQPFIRFSVSRDPVPHRPAPTVAQLLEALRDLNPHELRSDGMPDAQVEDFRKVWPEALVFRRWLHEPATRPRELIVHKDWDAMSKFDARVTAALSRLASPDAPAGLQ